MKCEKCGHDDTKITLLKTELKQLEQYVRETESQFNQSIKFLKEAEKLDRTNPTNREVFINMMKEGFSSELEQIRAKILMIRKISTEVADYLEQELNNYEKISRINIENLRRTSDPNFWFQTSLNEILEIITGLIAINSKISAMVNLCRLCIRDTIKRLE